MCLGKKGPNALTAGLANATDYSGCEPLVRNFYSQSVQVPTQCNAVDHSRWVMCSAIEQPLITRKETPQFYPTDSIKNVSKSADA